MIRVILPALLISFLVIVQATAAELTAGVARQDLTPPLSMNAPLGGYGARMNKPAEGVHDRIFAKALVLSDGNRRFVLVTCDLLGLTPAFRQEIAERLKPDGWTSDQILILPSHSHASIEMNAMNPNNVFGIRQIGIHDPKLLDFTVNKFVTLIRSAANELQPVELGTTSIDIPGWNRNRRNDSTLTDNELTVTRLDTMDGTPFAVLVNFTAHPTFMTEKEMLFSAGWPGALQKTLEAKIGQGVTAMYYNGAEGDQAPQSRSSGGNSRWEMATQYGLELGLLTADVWETIETQRDVAFDYHQETIDLPERSWHPDFMSTGGAEYGLSEEIMEDLLPRMSPEQTTSGSVRLGDLVIVGIPGEMAATLGMQIKKQTEVITGAKHAVIGGLANEWISYILTPEAYRSGHYEASVSFYGETLGPVIVDGALNGIRKLNRQSAPRR